MHSGSTKSQTTRMLENVEKGLNKTSTQFSNSPGLVRFKMSTIGRGLPFQMIRALTPWVMIF